MIKTSCLFTVMVICFLSSASSAEPAKTPMSPADTQIAFGLAVAKADRSETMALCLDDAKSVDQASILCDLASEYKSLGEALKTKGFARIGYDSGLLQEIDAFQRRGKYKCTVRDDTAEFYTDPSHVYLRLRRINGIWKIDPASISNGVLTTHFDYVRAEVIAIRKMDSRVKSHEFKSQYDIYYALAVGKNQALADLQAARPAATAPASRRAIIAASPREAFIETKTAMESGDIAEVARIVLIDPADREAADVFFEYSASMQRLSEAIGKNCILVNPQPDHGTIAEMKERARKGAEQVAAHITFAESGDTALAGKGDGKMRFCRTEKGWQMFWSPPPAERLPEFLKQYRAVTAAADSILADVERKKFKDDLEANRELQNEIIRRTSENPSTK